jgi:hypothetical protein
MNKRHEMREIQDRPRAGRGRGLERAWGGSAIHGADVQPGRPSRTGRRSMLGSMGGQPGLGRPQGCNGKQRALSNAVPVPMVLGGDAPAWDASWKKGQPLKLGRASFRNLVCSKSPHRASLAQWYLPQICAACQGGEWSRITRVLREGPAKPQSWCPSSTRAVSSPQSSDWRACLAVQSGPTAVASPGPKLRAIRCKCTHMRPKEKRAGPVSWPAPGQPHFAHPGIGSRTAERA